MVKFVQLFVNLFGGERYFAAVLIHSFLDFSRKLVCREKSGAIFAGF